MILQLTALEAKIAFREAESSVEPSPLTLLLAVSGVELWGKSSQLTDGH